MNEQEKIKQETTASKKITKTRTISSKHPIPTTHPEKKKIEKRRNHYLN